MKLKSKKLYLDELDSFLLPFTKVYVTDQDHNIVHDGYWINCMLQHWRVIAMNVSNSEDGEGILIIHCKA